MNIPKKRILVALCGAVALVLPPAMASSAISGQPNPEEISETDPAAYEDSLTNVVLTKAGTLTALKDAEGNEEAYYDALGDVTDNALEVLDKLKPGSRNWHAIKELLKDYNGRLEIAAFYYSKVNNDEMMRRFAQRFVDLHINKAFEGESLPKNDEAYPILVYNAASKAYNDKDFPKAIEYFKEYFRTGSTLNRETVYVFMGQACLNSKNYDLAVNTLSDAVKIYPNNNQLLMLAIKSCIDGGRADKLGPLVAQGLEQTPNNLDLLEIQAKLYEDENAYDKALRVWQRLDELNPQRLSTAKRIGLCYYNIAVGNFHDSQHAKDEKSARRLRQQAKNYFAGSAEKLEEVLVADPTASKYLKMLAVCYMCMEQKDRLLEVNDKLKALGEHPLEDMITPPMANFNSDGQKNYDWVVGSGAAGNEAPLYSEFGSQYVTAELKKWIAKGEFETLENYNKRVNQNTIKEQEARLNHEAQLEYLKLYSKKIRLQDLKLNPYDAQSETFMIESNCGPIFIKVPNKNNEAELFKSNWGGMRFQNPEFCIVNDNVSIASISVISPVGKIYNYDISDTNIDYRIRDVQIDLAAILGQGSTPEPYSGNNQYSHTEYVTLKSDVDENIPVNKQDNNNTFVLIVANEKYDNTEPVAAAEHDGIRFKEYCEKVLGIPTNHIQFETNASLGKLRRAINVLRNRIDAYGEPVDAIVYYAGHGMPDEKTKGAYLLPSDGDPQLISETGIYLDWFYTQLAEMKAESVMVFLDACFSGAGRDGGMLMSARAVAFKPKDSAPKGNMFVLSAASDAETALPYQAKNHGMFTYYLLKKLKETKGNVTLQDLTEYVTTNVRRSSSEINLKNQTPTHRLSGNMINEWGKKKLR